MQAGPVSVQTSSKEEGCRDVLWLPVQVAELDLVPTEATAVYNSAARTRRKCCRERCSLGERPRPQVVQVRRSDAGILETLQIVVTSASLPDPDSAIPSTYAEQEDEVLVDGHPVT